MVARHVVSQLSLDKGGDDLDHVQRFRTAVGQIADEAELSAARMNGNPFVPYIP